MPAEPVHPVSDLQLHRRRVHAIVQTIANEYRRFQKVPVRNRQRSRAFSRNQQLARVLVDASFEILNRRSGWARRLD